MNPRGDPLPGSPPSLTDTERAVYGPVAFDDLRAFLSAWSNHRWGSPIAEIVFRAGRIDIVWGVELADGRAVVIKIHRPPADVSAIATSQEAQRLLAGAGYPCATPLAPAEERDGHVLTAEELVAGDPPDGRDPESRRLLADGLARHIDILAHQGDLTRRAGRGPSWCRYQNGPWPVPHDTLVDFTTTTSGYGWLDDFGREASEQILAHRDPDQVVVGHADWYAGNTAVVDGVLIGTFDWELVADTEAVIAGFAAACYAASSTGSGGLSDPEEAAAFLRDYDTARGRRSGDREQRTAAGAVAWIIAFNARWQVGLIPHDLCDEATIALARDHGRDYLSLSW